MESAKHGNSETSSEENDISEKVNDDNTSSTTTGRSYDCTFCKRGFTNAQALGGHMNIHRKDKAKAKQLITDHSSLSNKPNQEEDYIPNSKYYFATEQQAHYYAALGVQMNYQTYFPAPNPNFPHAYNQTDHLPRNPSMHEDEEGMGANLSLRIGDPPHMEEDGKEKKKKGGKGKEVDLDLELRLGHDP